MKRILLVEDETLISLDLKNRLERGGYEVLPIAATAARAVELAGRERPDIVLVDVVLKGAVDGIDAARAIVAKNPVPILFITGTARFMKDARLEQIPVYRVLGKPAYESLLLDTIRELIP
jgi:two-component system, response regulator PdtaR